MRNNAITNPGPNRSQAVEANKRMQATYSTDAGSARGRSAWHTRRLPSPAAEEREVRSSSLVFESHTKLRGARTSTGRKVAASEILSSWLSAGPSSPGLAQLGQRLLHLFFGRLAVQPPFELPDRPFPLPLLLASHLLSFSIRLGFCTLCAWGRVESE